MQALERRQTEAAVACLRTQLAVLAPPSSAGRLHQLAACMLAASTAELHALAGWPPGGSSPAARQALLTALQVGLVTCNSTRECPFIRYCRRRASTH